MNTVLSEFLTEPFPARTTVYTKLPPGMLVEVDAIAVVEWDRMTSHPYWRPVVAGEVERQQRHRHSAN
jgi:hypothetical protein